MPTPEVKRARTSVACVFAVHGAVFGSFATRIPWIADKHDVGVGALGLALVAPALAAVATMPLAARVGHRCRGRRSIRILLTAWCAALVLPALAPNVGLLFVALLVYGAASGMADVVMNAQGVVVEQKYGRSIMSSLHGMWSVGGLVAAGAGVLAARAEVDARVHFAVAAVLLAAIGLIAAGGLLDELLPGDDAPMFRIPPRPVILIGLVGFCAVFAEGGVADWCAVYLTTVTGADPGTAAIAFSAFAFTMAGGRLLGDQVIRRLGPVTSVRLGGCVASAGSLLVLVARTPALAIMGFALMGLGLSVIVPLAFAAGGNSGVNPAHAIAGVATIAYGAGLAAPGAIGGIAQLSSLPVSFAFITVLCVLISFGASALAPRPATAAALITAE